MNDAADIVASTDWLTLASVDAAGAPLASYAPFVAVDSGVAIVVSALAAHSRNLFARPAASAVIVAGQTAPDGSFARARVSIDVRAHRAESASPLGAMVWAAFERRHGTLVATLRALPDFTPIVLEPLRARLVLGFADARDLAAAEVLAQIRAARESA